MKKRYFVFAILLSVLFFSSLTVYAYTDKEKKELHEIAIDATKKGPEKLVGKSKEVNKIGYGTGPEWEKNRAAIYQEILSWGCTKECASAICGNIAGEGNFDPTILQNLVSYDKWSYGTTGTGITQWTYHTRQSGLFRSCEFLKKGWNDLGAQLAYLKWEVTETNNHYFSWDKYKDSTDTKAITNDFMMRYENPKTPNLDKRLENAKKAMEACKDLPAKPFDGSALSSSSSSSNSEDINDVLDEGALTGMPSESKLLEKQSEVEIADGSDLSIGENHSLSTMTENMEIQKKIKAFDLSRRVIMFIGLILVVYSFTCFVSIIFDNVNNWVEFSLVKVVSFGRINYYPNRDKDTLDTTKYHSTKRVVISTVMIFIVGIVIISGSVLEALSGFAWWLSERL